MQSISEIYKNKSKTSCFKPLSKQIEDDSNLFNEGGENRSKSRDNKKIQKIPSSAD